MPSLVHQGEPIYLDNTAPRRTRGSRSPGRRGATSTVLGLNWDDDSGRNNGHLASFSWNG